MPIRLSRVPSDLVISTSIEIPQLCARKGTLSTQQPCRAGTTTILDTLMDSHINKIRGNRTILHTQDINMGSNQEQPQRQQLMASTHHRLHLLINIQVLRHRLIILDPRHCHQLPRQLGNMVHMQRIHLLRPNIHNLNPSVRTV